MSKDSKDLIQKHLAEFGLSAKEVKIYLTLLEAPRPIVQQIARLSKINRSSTYVVLESLREKGLVSISDKEKVRHYIASSPEILLQSAEERSRKQESVRQKIQSIVPELKGLHKDTQQKPKVKIFEGTDGVIAAFEDTLDSREKITRVASRVENLYSIIPDDYFPSYIKRRLEKGIWLKGIHPKTKFSEKIMELAPAIHEQSVMIPESKFNFPADFAIYDNKIAYISSENGGIAIIIESEKIAEIMKSIFDMAWAEAKRLTKKDKKN